jgi:hypothetical protein
MPGDADAPADEWDHVVPAEGRSLALCCALRIGATYRVAVAAVALDGVTHRPAEAVANTTLFELAGAEPLPAAPENLRLVRRDDRAWLTWDEVEYGAPVEYEVHTSVVFVATNR